MYFSPSISLNSTSATRDIHRKLKTCIINYWLLTRGIELASAMAIAFILDLCMNHPWESCQVCLSIIFYTLLHGYSPQQFMYGVTTFLPSKGMFLYCGYWMVILSRFLSMRADGKLKARFVTHTHSQKLYLQPHP